MQNISKIALLSLVLHSFYIVSALQEDVVRTAIVSAPKEHVRIALELAAKVYPSVGSSGSSAGMPVSKFPVVELAVPQGKVRHLCMLTAGLDGSDQADGTVSVFRNGWGEIQGATQSVDISVDIENRLIMTSVDSKKPFANKLIVQSSLPDGEVINKDVPSTAVFFVVAIDEDGNLYCQMIVAGQICRLVSKSPSAVKAFPVGNRIHLSAGATQVKTFAMFADANLGSDLAGTTYIYNTLPVVNAKLAQSFAATLNIKNKKLSIYRRSTPSVVIDDINPNGYSDKNGKYLIIVQDDKGQWFTLVTAVDDEVAGSVTFATDQYFSAQQNHGPAPVAA